MSNIDSPAGSPGGPVTLPALDDLPDKMRVHALARLLSRTSKEVLGALAGLGIEVRGAQSSIDRKMAEQVVTALLPGAGPGASIAETQLPIPDTQPVSPRRTAAADPAFSAASVPPATTPPAATPDVGAPPVGALTPLFAAPAPLFQAPARPAAGRTGRRAPDPDPDDGAVEVGPTAVSTPRDTGSGDAEDLEDDAGEDAGASGIDDSDDEDGAARRRRRRGRRGRGRGRGGDELEDDAADTAGTDTAGTESDGAQSDGAQSDGAESGGIVGVGTDESASADSDPGTDSAETDDAESDADSEFDGGDGDAGGSRRRRRRRRRRGTGDEAADGAAETGEDDPPATITRVRRPREPRAERDADGGGDGDGVQGVRGSTRLEAKRQRRRDGRDAGRRRVPILSEAEFLARRESVDRAMVVRERGGRVEIAVLEDDVLVEHFVAGAGSQSAGGQSMVGNIYLGRVQNVLPSMEAAFVDIGRGRNAVLYAGEVDWDAAGLGGKARRIEQALSSGDPVLVQVTKDPIGHKGARLTTQISLAGRFLVYVPSGGAAGISRKLPDVERKRLKDMLKEIVPSEAGVIIRTASEGVSHEALERDVRRLQAQWDVVRTRSEQTGPNKPKAPVLLYEEPDLLIKVVRDQFNEDFSRLVVQGDDGFDTLANYVGHVAPELADRLHRHTGAADVFTEFRIDEQLLKALDRKVWLPSGGTLVIDRTEAMTVVDVNTGKYTGSGGNLEETVTRNNLEAAEEIVRQLRLRDIGGIIVIDFIDMVLEGNRDLVLRRLTECLSRDRTRHQVAEVTSLGLVQMTRKRVGGGLLEHFSTPCEHCRGRGVIISAEPITEPGDEGRGSGGAEGAGRRSRGGRGARRGEGDGERGGQDGRGDGPGGGGRQNGSGHAAAMAPVIESPVIESPVIGRPAGGSPVGGSAVVGSPVGGSPEVEAPAIEAPVAEVPAVAERAPADATAVERLIVEAAPPVDEPVGGTPADGISNGSGRPARQRRSRVTRTAGSPAAPDGDAQPAAVVTVATQPVPAPAVEPVAVLITAPAEGPQQPVPSTASRPRRTRRSASRPAGPPVGDAGANAGGDPV